MPYPVASTRNRNFGPPPLPYTEKVKSIFGSSLIAYWPLNEPSGTTALDASGNGRNGTYYDVTLGQPGIGDGTTAAFFSGATSTSRVDIYSDSFRDAFNGQEGTFSCWFKVNSAADWTDGAQRRIVNIEVDSNNNITIDKKSQVNKWWWGHKANAVYKAIDGQYFSPTKWTHLAATWSVAANESKFYLNGVPYGGTLTGLGIWAGLPGSTKTCLGNSQATGGNVWKGYLAHAAFGNTALTASQIQQLARSNYDGFDGLMIRFDDQDASLLDGFNYMNDRGLKGTMFVTTNNVNTAGYMTDANLRTMQAAGWVIGNHTRDHTVLTGLTEALQEAEFSDAITALTGWGITSRNAHHAAYPSGGWDANTLTAMTNLSMLTGQEATPTAGYEIDDPFIVHPYVIRAHWVAAATTTLANVQSVITTARAKGKYCVIYFHRFVATGGAGNQWGLDKFYPLIDWIIAQGIPCKTVEDFYTARTA